MEEEIRGIEARFGSGEEGDLAAGKNKKSGRKKKRKTRRKIRKIKRKKSKRRRRS